MANFREILSEMKENFVPLIGLEKLRDMYYHLNVDHKTNLFLQTTTMMILVMIIALMTPASTPIKMLLSAGKWFCKMIMTFMEKIELHCIGNSKSV